MKIDVNDVKLGFWIAAGFALFTLLLGLITRLGRRAVSGGSDGG